jgi:drug/metabolite transporter (DMT)-like permease
LFSVWFVPGVRLTPKLIAALLLAITGLVLANFKQVGDLFSGAGGRAPTFRHFLPYALALVAAVTWAIYSVQLVLWRSWARNYVTSPIGFILIGLIGGLVMLATGTLPRALTGLGALMTVFYGVGPLAAGYLLWELALSRARVQTLSLFAAAIPILSTLFLCCCVRRTPGPELLCAVLLLVGAVLLSLREK